MENPFSPFGKFDFDKGVHRNLSGKFQTCLEFTGFKDDVTSVRQTFSSIWQYTRRNFLQDLVFHQHRCEKFGSHRPISLNTAEFRIALFCCATAVINIRVNNFIFEITLLEDHALPQRVMQHLSDAKKKSIVGGEAFCASLFYALTLNFTYCLRLYCL